MIVLSYEKGLSSAESSAAWSDMLTRWYAAALFIHQRPHLRQGR